MIVVDASVVVSALVDDGPGGATAQARLRESGEMHAPHLLDLEVVSRLRRGIHNRELDSERAMAVLDALATLAVIRYAHTLLLPRVWELRDNLTPYDAVYVALAEALDTALLTADQGMAGAPGVRCPIEVVR